MEQSGLLDYMELLIVVQIMRMTKLTRENISSNEPDYANQEGASNAETKTGSWDVECVQ